MKSNGSLGSEAARTMQACESTRVHVTIGLKVEEWWLVYLIILSEMSSQALPTYVFLTERETKAFGWARNVPSRSGQDRIHCVKSGGLEGPLTGHIVCDS